MAVNPKTGELERGNFNFKCENCKGEIPMPEKEIYKIKEHVLPKFCDNCHIEAPKQSMRTHKERKK